MQGCTQERVQIKINVVFCFAHTQIELACAGLEAELEDQGLSKEELTQR